MTQSEVNRPALLRISDSAQQAAAVNELCAVAVKPPEKKPRGQWVGHVRDNNGFIVEICSSIG